MAAEILGLYPQPAEPKPFIVADQHNRAVLEINPDDFWQYEGGAMRRTSECYEDEPHESEGEQ